MERGGGSTRSNSHIHRLHHQSQQNRKSHGSRQEPDIDFVCKVKYSNALPDLPFEPKFLQSPFISLSRFINYKPSTLEKNFKYELLTEPDLNVKIDLINPNTYKIDPAEKPQMHPIDEQLIEDETISQLNSKRSIQHRKVVPWMRKTEYISTQFNRYGLGQTGMERPDTKVGYGMKKRNKDEPFDYKDRTSQIAAIEKTFEDAKRPVRRHYSRPGVHALEEFQIFPDFEMWKYPFAQVIFDADPLPYCKTNREEKLEQSILRGMADSEGNQFVGYFSPFDEALEQRLADDREKMGAYRENFEYQYKLEREYNWAVQNKATKGYEQENYFLIRRDNAFFYNELETRVKLARRVKSSTSASSKNTILSVINRPLNGKEMNQMNRRARMLFAIQEEDDEEEEEEGEEEENADHQQREDERNGKASSEEQQDGQTEQILEKKNDKEAEGGSLNGEDKDEEMREYDQNDGMNEAADAKSSEEESTPVSSEEEESSEEENEN